MEKMVLIPQLFIQTLMNVCRCLQQQRNNSNSCKTRSSL